ncbi:MAG: hypothetical protein CL792_06535 [Chloroflexi bacterium]|nr:hypothetical protein [Chloroflexota bacterium]|tara:strand:- start:619 stop:996 length:378 start_codon:yes stop_codon:yes gene_type:complete
MTNITESRVDTLDFNSETKTLDITFNDLNILSTGGVDVLVLNLNEWDNDIPFYLDIDERIFALQPSNTYLVSGHGAQLPNWITDEESEDRLTILVERNERYLVYSHDTLATDDDDSEENIEEQSE